MDLAQALGFILLGFGTGAYGTLIGAGGGFVLMPLLLLLFPNEQADVLTSISLAVVFFNAASGTGAYASMRRIDYRSGLAFALAATPGAVLGALGTGLLPRRAFDTIFGALLVAGAVFLIMRSPRPGSQPRARTEGEGGHLTHRRIVDSQGVVHEYAFPLRRGVVISVFVGFVSSFLGIGGGIIHVPAMIYLLDFPVHVATATSHFVLMLMALAGTLTHVAIGSFHHGLERTLYLSIGVLGGAQAGAYLSNHIKGRFIIQSLALALAFVGARILLLGLS
ncbi:protein of unknown function DUF81 [Desulfovibrio sp. X2]|uniref:sulfite exporter TauE/SafE family protein n=1 Tax=Desulfovibrio sp. X2 TaxID=941449 RepID=UPI000358919D|nr:sulfite exporter TauE/SafE family protein [Desulfovibrio sp. X2]EPR44669.1 protein of unknown function DUF81 [Desulfovibrio sp. X2]